MVLRLSSTAQAATAFALLGLCACGHVDAVRAWDEQPDGTVVLRTRVGSFQTNPQAAPELEKVLAGDPDARRHFALDATLGQTNAPDALDGLR